MNYSSRLRLWLLLSASCLPAFLAAQILTRVNVDDSAFHEAIYWAGDEVDRGKSTDNARASIPSEANEYTLELRTDYEDLASEVAQRKRETGRALFEVSIPAEVTDKVAGTFEEYGNYTNYRLRVVARDAKQLRFEFGKLVLPEGAEAYFYNDTRDFLMGPITRDQITDERLVTDVVAGEAVTLDVFLPEEMVDVFELQLDAVYYGVTSVVPRSSGYGTAQPCTINTVCNEGLGWEEQRRATVILLADPDDGFCSGTLVENECRDNRPLVYTAAHCIGNDGITSAANIIYRIGYEGLSCPNPGGEPARNQWISFNGATLLAERNRNDFAILELNQNFEEIDFPLFFAGWDRSGNRPNETTIISHPSGDVMKIAHDANAPTFRVVTVGGFGDVDSWMCNYTDSGDDFGFVEGGSSGGGLYGPGRRLIGSLSHGERRASCESVGNEEGYGRLTDAWNGGGTAATSARPHLSPVANLVSMDARRPPQVDGPDLLCSNSRIYQLRDAPAGSTVTWEVDNPGLISGATQGTGSTVSLRGTSWGRGVVELTFTIANGTPNVAGCPDDLTVVKTISVGKPIPNFTLPSCVNKAQYVALASTSFSGGSPTYQWTFPSGWNNPSGNQARVRPYVGSSASSGSVSLFVTNACGTRSINRRVNYCPPPTGGGPGPCCGQPIPFTAPGGTKTWASPSFAVNFVNINTIPSQNNQVGDVTISDALGRVVAHYKAETLPLSVDLASYPNGMYFTTVTVAGDEATATRFNVQR